jgi:tripartite-type tricarboxylate transporter receptor subunit TctC
MKLPHRRQFLHLAAGATALSTVSRMAKAQTYPTRPVRLIVGFAPGGGPVDLLARLIGQRLSERFGQPFIVDNRPGASGNLATEAVVRSPSDGHTLLVTGVNEATNATLYEKLNFNFVRDIAPVASIMRSPIVMVVHPSVPARTAPEFIAFARANPGRINMASAGVGTGGHLAGELFKAMAGVDMVHVPYRGGAPAMTEVLAGRMHVIFVVPTLMLEHMRAGTLRALAVTTTERWDGLPDLPTVGEFVRGYEASAWFGVGAPRNTPGEIIDRLNTEINRVLAEPMTRTRLAEAGGTVLIGSPTDFGKLIVDETEKWGKVIRAANIKPE